MEQWTRRDDARRLLPAAKHGRAEIAEDVSADFANKRLLLVQGVRKKDNRNRRAVD